MDRDRIPRIMHLTSHPTADQKGIAVIALTSILLGIWATVGTIALRNFLLVLGTILSIIYLTQWFRAQPISFFHNQFRSSNFLYLIPSTLIVAMFIWVIVHYVFFSQFPQKQWDELTSTWLRSLMASIIGYACALALCRNQSFAWLLGLGLIVSFLVLFFQYIPKAVVAQSLLATDWFGSYIYWAKFSGVLVGTVLVAGTLGVSLDGTRRMLTSYREIDNQSSRFQKIGLGFMIALGLFLPIYAFVYIFSAKNGVGVAAILFIFWFIVGSVYLVILFFRIERHQFSNRNQLRLLLCGLIVVSTFTWLGYQHLKNNPGWESLIEDIRISAQIDTYQHWKSPPKYGYPKRADGSSVAANTYERVAWAVVGFTLIVDHPKGNGILRALPSQMRQGGIDFNDAAYTHSAWIDLGLSYGWLGLLLLPTALLVCLLLCTIRYHSLLYSATVVSLAVSFLVLYLVGEYAFQHGIEILLFISALMAGLILFDPKNNSGFHSNAINVN
jgi:hypothetical protein